MIENDKKLKRAEGSMKPADAGKPAGATNPAGAMNPSGAMGPSGAGKPAGPARQLKRYAFFLVTLAGLALVSMIAPETGAKASGTILTSLREMILIIPPVFVLLGLLDVWVPRETMMRYMGEKSGAKGAILAILLGSAAAGPLYGAFPVAAVFMKKGARFSNVLLFLGAWSTTKIPMLLFELSSMGARFTLTRLAMSLAGIFIIAAVVERSLGRAEIEAIYLKARSD